MGQRATSRLQRQGRYGCHDNATRRRRSRLSTPGPQRFWGDETLQRRSKTVTKATDHSKHLGERLSCQRNDSILARHEHAARDGTGQDGGATTVKPWRMSPPEGIYSGGQQGLPCIPPPRLFFMGTKMSAKVYWIKKTNVPKPKLW